MRGPRALVIVAIALAWAPIAEAKEISLEQPGQEGIDRVKEAQRQYEKALERAERLEREADAGWDVVMSAGLGALLLREGDPLSREDFDLFASAKKAEGVSYEDYLAALQSRAEWEKAREELARLGNALIELTDEVYKITRPDGLDGEPTFRDIDVIVYVHRRTWEVGLGLGALSSPDGTLSPGWIAANKVIAFTYVQQKWDGRQHVNVPEGVSHEWRLQERRINQVEAFDRALGLAQQLGLSEAEIESLRKMREEAFSELTDANKRRITEKGDYTTAPKDTDPKQQQAAAPRFPMPPIEFEPIPVPLPLPSSPAPAGGNDSQKEPKNDPKTPDEDTSKELDLPTTVKVEFFGNGSTFSADLKVKNETDKLQILNILPGTFLHAEKNTIQMLATIPCPYVLVPPKSEGYVRIPALCTDRDKKPPGNGMVLVPGVTPADPSLWRPPPDPSLFGDPDFPPFRSTEKAKEHDPPSSDELKRLLWTGFAMENHFNRERIQIFVVPTEDAPGPFEQANPPAGADAPPSEGTEVKSLAEIVKEVTSGSAAGLPDTPTVIPFRTSASDEPGAFRVILVGERPGEQETPKDSFNDTVRTTVFWAITNGDGTADRPYLQEQAFKRFKEQGASDAAARGAARQVADEVVEEAEEILEEAEDFEKEPQISFKINMTLKGVTQAPH